MGFRDSKSYSRLASIDGGSGSSGAAGFSSMSSSRSGSPAPLPPSDQFAYSTSLRRHEEPHSSLLDFHGHAAAAVNSAANATRLGRDDHGGRFSAYDLPPQQHDHHFAAAGTGHSHHPLAHTTQPLTPSSHYAGQSIPQTISTLGTSATSGLPSDKVHAVRELSGPNEFEVGAKDPLWKRFAGQFKEPLIMLLLGSAVVSAFVGNYDDAASIVVAVMIVVTGKAARDRAWNHITWLTLCELSYSRIRAGAALGEVSRGPEQAGTALYSLNTASLALVTLFRPY